MSNFIVGDLHGQYDILISKLNEMGFDRTKDHLYSVGDLIDRGPKSLACVRLLQEEWFHAVRGNHEAMFLTAHGDLYSHYHSSRDYMRNGGEWSHSLSEEEMKEAVTLLEQLPLAIHTDNFSISHSFAVTELDLPYPDRIVWDRGEVFRSIKDRTDIAEVASKYLEYNGNIFKWEEYDPSRKLWYVGHNTIKGVPMFVGNQVMLDTGVSKDGCLTVVRHEDVLEWLK
jgi:serine/threonine protein phosphatase 1